ncbi:MAG: hypothetical protein QGH33_10885 [Pirellulaceae bacterium]|jgi:hypothetical protein|nr:hypothetical protein [Pirellulaceae bacterium]MDP7292221.1 hypothetical protein [Verrucomicrobiota bacterium]HJN13357.1 hypothetical protein [Pirellulaceae bacterium]
MANAGCFRLPICVCVALYAVTLAHGQRDGGVETELTIGRPLDRSDRLITISGDRSQELVAEYSADGGKKWHVATIYCGVTIDDWRTCDESVWNRGAIEGKIPAGDKECLWSYFFDVAMPADEVRLRLRRSGDDKVLKEQAVDLRDVDDVFVIDQRNAVQLAGGALPAPWQLKPEGKKKPAVPSIACPVDEPSTPPLVFHPNLKGWHRIYIGIEPFAPCQMSLSKENIWYPVPDHHQPPNKQGRNRFCREYYLKSADLSGQSLCLALGGTVPTWHDASARHIRFVPMSTDEITRFQDVRKLAEAKGRPFAGYVEQCTAGYYERGALTLRDHTRNEMRLNGVRGATEVYVHVIRVGSKAWYHSDIVERCIPEPGQAHEGWVKFGRWMKQGDPLAVAVEEARKVGLKVFPDMGMNVTYLTRDPDYHGLAERTSREHSELLVDGQRMFLNYRKEKVREYAAEIARELMTKYDVDGIHLDFARFACNKAFDEPSLVDVLRRINDARRSVEKDKGRRILIAARIPSYQYATDAKWAQKIYGGDHPWFTEALKSWARNGWVDRVMVCCPIPERFDKLSLERYRAAISGSDVKLWGDLYGGDGRPRSLFLDAARKWTQTGVDGGFFFYSVCRPTEFEQINWMLRFIDFPDVNVEPHDFR